MALTWTSLSFSTVRMSISGPVSLPVNSPASSSIWELPCLSICTGVEDYLGYYADDIRDRPMFIMNLKTTPVIVDKYYNYSRKMLGNA